MQALFRGVRTAIGGADDHDGSASASDGSETESASDSGGETVLMERELRVVDGQLVLSPFTFLPSLPIRLASAFSSVTFALLIRFCRCPLIAV